MENSATGYLLLDGNEENYTDEIIQKWQNDKAFKEDCMRKFKAEIEGKNLPYDDLIPSINDLEELKKKSTGFMLPVITLSLLCLKEILKELNEAQEGIDLTLPQPQTKGMIKNERL